VNTVQKRSGLLNMQTYHSFFLSEACWKEKFCSVQFSQSGPTLCDPMNRSTPGLPVHHHLPEFTQTHVHRVSDAIQLSHPLSSPSPPAPNPSQHQSLFQWVNSLREVAKVLEFQLQHQSFQWTSNQPYSNTKKIKTMEGGIQWLQDLSILRSCSTTQSEKLKDLWKTFTWY